MAESTDVAAESTESEFLAQQAQAAQAALAQAWGDLKTKLAHGVDPKAWAKQHPWLAIGGAAVAGFATTAALVPSKEQQVLRKLADLERALHPPMPIPVTGEGKKDKGGMLTKIALEAFGMLRPIVTSLLAAQMGGAPVSADGQTDANGHAAAGHPVTPPAP